MSTFDGLDASELRAVDDALSLILGL